MPNPALSIVIFLMLLITPMVKAADVTPLDSLEEALKNYPYKKEYSQVDSMKVNLLLKLSRTRAFNQDNDAAKKYADEALEISEKIGFKSGQAMALECYGMVYMNLGNYPEALNQYYKALQINESVGDKYAIATTYSSLGIIYGFQGNYNEYLKLLFASLKIYEELHDKKNTGKTHGNIANVYTTQGNHPGALQEYLKSLRLYEEIKDSVYIAMAHGNLGHVYNAMGKYNLALNEQRASLHIKEQLGNKRHIAGSHNNIGLIYEQQGKFEMAIDEYLIALNIYEQVGDKSGMAWSYVHIGNLKSEMKNTKEGREWMMKGVALYKELGNKEGIKTGYEKLDIADTTLGNYKDAYRHYRAYILYRDSLDNEEIRKKSMHAKMQYEFDKKEALLEAASDAKIRRQKIIRNSAATGFAATLVFLVVVFRQRNKISKARKRSDELLLNILPSEVADELKMKGSADAKQFDEVTVMFTDFKGFTQISERLSPTELVSEIHHCFKAFDNIIEKYNVEKIKSIGDSYMCAGGLPVTNNTHTEDVISAAIEIQKFMLEHSQQRKNENKEIFEIRIGIHTGPVVAGIVGIKKFAYDIWGDTVNIASRMESSGEAGKVNISGSTYDSVKDKFKCIHRGKIQAKNKGEIDMYFVESI